MIYEFHYKKLRGQSESIDMLLCETRERDSDRGCWRLANGEAQLPANWRELAKKHGIEHEALPAQLGTKVKDVSIPLRMVLFHVGTNTSLKTTTAMAAAAGMIDMSAVALHKWMRKMGT